MTTRGVIRAERQMKADDRARAKMRRDYEKLVRLVAEPNHDPEAIANAHKAIAAYEALPEHLR